MKKLSFSERKKILLTFSIVLVRYSTVTYDLYYDNVSEYTTQTGVCTKHVETYGDRYATPQGQRRQREWLGRSSAFAQALTWRFLRQESEDTQRMR